MKKLYTTNKFKKFNKRRIKRSQKRRNKKYSFKRIIPQDKIEIKDEVIASSDLRVVGNTIECFEFFKNIRNQKNTSVFKEYNFVKMSLKEVEKIDYGTISILTAISEDLKYKDVTLHGNFPNDIKAKTFLIESGFLSYMYDKSGKRFPRSSKSSLIFFEKGSGKFSENDNKRISRMIREGVEHLTGKNEPCPSLKTMILEICGNSIEWGETDKKQWLFGLKYEKEKILFTVTDVGTGILNTLHRKFGEKFKDTFSLKSDLEILEAAFQKKYGSSSREENRNKGLPSIRIKFQEGKIKNLIVLTNNVILHFNDKRASRTLSLFEPYYRGTFYQWEFDRDCLKKISEEENEYKNS